MVTIVFVLMMIVVVMFMMLMVIVMVWIVDNLFHGIGHFLVDWYFDFLVHWVGLVDRHFYLLRTNHYFIQYIKNVK